MTDGPCGPGLKGETPVDQTGGAGSIPAARLLGDFTVVKIAKRDAEPWLRRRHYAKSVPTIDFAFGLFMGAEKVGVCTFGRPPNRNLNDGRFFFQDGFSVRLIELNRLVVNDGLPKNSLSYFVSKCLAELPNHCCVVSYADANWGHHGYIYQALGWLYTGESSAEPLWISPDGRRHRRRHVHLKAGLLREDSKELVRLGWCKIDQFPKHRYVVFIGNRREKREMRKALKVSILPYPKGDNRRYDVGKEERSRAFF